MSLDKDEYQKWFNEGETDAAEDRNNLLSGPWCGPLESFEHYDQRVDAYESGRDHHDSGSGSDSSSGSSGCFFTTACVTHAGLADDCEELQVLREFRDNYVASLPTGPILIKRYYQTAPAIVKAIVSTPSKDCELSEMLVEVRSVVSDIKAKRYNCAVRRYQNMYNRLSATYNQGRVN